jgi:Glycosyltransferase (GlcNAc)
MASSLATGQRLTTLSLSHLVCLLAVRPFDHAIDMESAVLSDPLAPMAKGKKRIKKRGDTASSPTFVLGAASPGSNSVELGLLLTVAVMGLYLFGFFQSLKALPNVPPAIPWRQGANLNLARDEFSHTVDTSNTRDLVGTQPKVLGSEKRTIRIPEHKWPVTVRDEKFETILHPGDNTTTMLVPKFWSLPIHNNELMTRETALKVGSCIQPDSKGNFARGDKCPIKQRTIYLAIASYRDFECRSTIESAFLRAKHPERLRVGVVDQIVDGEDPKCNEPIEPCDKNPHQALCLYQGQVDIYQIQAELSVGPVFARHLGHRLYRGTYCQG